MTSVREKVASELKVVLGQATELERALGKEDIFAFIQHYQQWYTRAMSVVKILIPAREADFRRLYERDNKRRALNVETYALEDYTQGLSPFGSKNFHPDAS